MSMRGMSLIEMLVVLAIVPIITIAISDSVIFFYRANSSSLEEAYQIQSGQNGVQTLVHDLREATYADDGSYPLATMATSSITFYSDVDHDMAVERVHYELNKTSLTRTVTNSVGTPPTYTGPRLLLPYPTMCAILATTCRSLRTMMQTGIR